jgi:hypothetical protein
MTVPMTIVTGLPAAGKSFYISSVYCVAAPSEAHERVTIVHGRKELNDVYATESEWPALRASLEKLVHTDGSFWPVAGIDSLVTAWSPFAHAELERRAAAVVARSVARQVSRRPACTLIIEATPILAVELIATFASQLILVRATEHERAERLRRRIAEKNHGDTSSSDEFAQRVAAFHRAAYQPALFVLKAASHACVPVESRS